MREETIIKYPKEHSLNHDKVLEDRLVNYEKEQAPMKNYIIALNIYEYSMTQT